jgi:tryptophan halogenase
MNHVNSVAVVGGGTAGLVSALILKKSYPDIDIAVIRSKDIGIIGVGEGSTEHWSNFMDFIGIEFNDLIKNTDATFKSGIMFKNWGAPDYLQSIGDGFNLTHRGYPFVYGSQISKNCDPRDLVSPLAWNSRANIWFLGQPEARQVQQYHFNTHKLNSFLESLCLRFDVRLIDDEITNVNISDNGEISVLEGKSDKYDYDFYIDCTGFRRLLISKLGSEWKSYSKYLKMNSAIVFPTDIEEDIPMWTVAQGMNSGWMFRLPVWGRFGNGYIFNDAYITPEDAQKEVEELLGKEINVSKTIKFDPGALDCSWIKNCCAIGLSSSFVEPLEASSIGTSIQQAFLLSENIINYNDSSIKDYNQDVTDILENIRDFIVLHYLGGRDDTPFWKDIKNLEIPKSLKTKLDLWRNKLPSEKDFSKVTNKILFSHFHFILILHGLNLFNIESIEKEYKLTVPEDKRQQAEMIVREGATSPYTTIPHKTMLEVIRNIKTWPDF